MIPTATYRLQFRHGMDFERAAALVDYLSRLGVSHLYASPLFAAVPGSTHGYDGIDFAAIEPAIGGEVGFETLTRALDAAGLGLLLDFVPNHMAADERNGWWRSVLEWGRKSPFAGMFDIDWSTPALVLPMLGEPYDAALANGLFGIALDGDKGCFTLTVYDRHLPLTPPSFALLLERVDDPAIAGLAESFATVGPDRADALKRRLASLAGDERRAAALIAATADAAADRAFLHNLHEAQPWRLVHWRLARTRLTWRRFFEISDLVCLRVEDPVAFDAVHAFLFTLIASGRVDGVRLDHIDGLADPGSYLERLQRDIGSDAPFYLLVEKVLEPGEPLRADWPVAGTTGYEFTMSLAGLFVDRRQEAAMTDAYHGFVGNRVVYEDLVRASKRQLLEHNLAVELERLVAVAAHSGGGSVHPPDALRRAIVAMVAELPVYRTYVDRDGADAADHILIDGMARDASRLAEAKDRAAIRFLSGLLKAEPGKAADRTSGREFAMKFQQVTGPVMAKAVEDTVFYRYNRLIGLNEVGGAPQRFGAPLADFHAAMADRFLTQPAGLSTTATHDTKRGEDSRARLYALSEAPGDWQRAVARWAGINAVHRTNLPSDPAPEPAIEWMFYQALAGAWPADLIVDDKVDGEEDRLAALRDRMCAYMVKAVREAKQRTSWTDRDAAYEAAVERFVEGVLSPGTEPKFLRDFATTCRPFWIAGALNGLAQLAIKLTAPGVPDFYQGSELWDFSLVDPDNRSSVDFATRQRLLATVRDLSPATLLENWRSGAPKMALTVLGLRARSMRQALFMQGPYSPLASTGAHARRITAFARSLQGDCAILLAPRLSYRLLEGVEKPIVPADRWDDTSVVVPDDMEGRDVVDIVTGVRRTVGRTLSVSAVLSEFPVAILLAAPLRRD